MVFNNVPASDGSLEEEFYPFHPKPVQEYTPLSLNHLIREGIQAYLLSKKKRAKFELDLCENLNRISGEPNQLRRVFTQMVECIVESTKTNSPRITFNTKNLTIPRNRANILSKYEYLSLGTYVSLRIEIDNWSNLPHFGANGPENPKHVFPPFVWSQICEVIEIHGGKIFGVDEERPKPAEARINLEVVLPALKALEAQ